MFFDFNDISPEFLHAATGALDVLRVEVDGVRRLFMSKPGCFKYIFHFYQRSIFHG